MLSQNLNDGTNDMRSLFLKILSYLPNNIQSRLAFYIERFSHSYFHTDTVNLLFDKLGSNKLNYLDVGARRGVDTKHWGYRHFLNFVLFEPDPIECQYLKNFYSNVNNLALSDHPGELELNITQDPGGSYTSDNTLARDFYGNNLMKKIGVVGNKTDVLEKFICEKKRLDECNIEGHIVVLKVDVQGDELSVLKGLGEARPGCIKVEVSTNCTDQKPSQLEEILIWARESNYLLVGASFSNKREFQFKSTFENCFQGDYLLIDGNFKTCPDSQLLVSMGLILFDCVEMAIAIIDDPELAQEVKMSIKSSSQFSHKFAISKYNNAHDKRNIEK